MEYLKELTDEMRRQIPAHNERWIRNAFSTEAMTEEDRHRTVGILNHALELVSKRSNQEKSDKTDEETR